MVMSTPPPANHSFGPTRERVRGEGDVHFVAPGRDHVAEGGFLFGRRLESRGVVTRIARHVRFVGAGPAGGQRAS
jgi:hypothetical protein